MKKLASIAFCFLIFGFVIKPVFASYDPISKTNNKFGIHILFTTELQQAAKLVNTSGGDWGYVTIPIQYGDRDLEKWQKFMSDCQTFHLIPIVRLATEPLYSNSRVWRKPNLADIVDFSNFLNSLIWPTKNRYIIVFNEVNRSDEWGGKAPNPAEYAEILNFATEVFTQRNDDFFVISAGLDNASPNDGVSYVDNFVFLRGMGQAIPEVFERVNGIGSHSYPNPGFSQPPSESKPESTSTYKFESNIVEQFAKTKKPVFITETGWNTKLIGEDTASSYLNSALDSWNKDSNVIAVTPFLLDSQNGTFDQFSFLKNSEPTKFAKSYVDFAKQKGDPILTPDQTKRVLAAVTFQAARFDSTKTDLSSPDSNTLLKFYFKIILGLN